MICSDVTRWRKDTGVVVPLSAYSGAVSVLARTVWSVHREWQEGQRQGLPVAGWERAMSTAQAEETHAEELRELIEHIVRVLVDEPSQVKVVEVKGENMIVYELRVAPGDVGRVIGKGGRTANAVRTLLRAASGRRGMRAGLEILS